MLVIAKLKTSRVKFVACDDPHADELTIDILVAVADDEGRRISLRTREAPAAYGAGRRVPKRIRLLDPDGVPAEVVAAAAGKLGAELPWAQIAQLPRSIINDFYIFILYIDNTEASSSRGRGRSAMTEPDRGAIGRVREVRENSIISISDADRSTPH